MDEMEYTVRLRMDFGNKYGDDLCLYDEQSPAIYIAYIKYLQKRLYKVEQKVERQMKDKRNK